MSRETSENSFENTEGNVEEAKGQSTVISIGEANVTGTARSAIAKAGLSPKGFAVDGKTDFDAALNDPRFERDFMQMISSDDELPAFNVSAALKDGGLLDEHIDMLMRFRDLAARNGKTLTLMGLSATDKLRIEMHNGRANGTKLFTDQHADQAFRKTEQAV